MSESRITISALRHLGAKPHRIEWFGQIHRSATARVAVVFSPWGMDSQTGEMRSDARKHVTARIPVAFLRLFRIGDIWENGYKTGQRDILTRETFHLELRDQSVKIMPAGAPLNDDPHNPEYPLPFSLFGGHAEHTLAQCARVQLDGDSTLVVPCMELVRFYFGASGSFLKRLFSGAFALDRLFMKARRSPNSLAANIDLAEDLSGTAAATVARIAFDAQARSAAAWIVNSAVASAANKARYYPKTTFPFHGETNLTVDGRWIEHNGHRVFLAEQLVRCTHPFPFSALFYTTRNSAMNYRRLYGSGARDSFNTDGRADTSRPPALQLNQGAVSRVLQPVGIPGDEVGDESFPDLAQKKIRRVKPFVPNGPAKPRDEMPQLGTGDETSTSDVRAAEVIVDVEEASFDNAVIEELPTEAADMFWEAFGAFESASKGLYRMIRPSSVPGYEKLLSGPFVRGDGICATGGIRLERVWCAVIMTTDDPLNKVLVMARSSGTRDFDDHLVMVHLDGAIDSRKELVQYCGEFAQGRLPETLKRKILFTWRTEWAADFHFLLQGMSIGFNQVYSGPPDEDYDPSDPETTGGLKEPLFSMNELTALLRAARAPR